MLIKHLPIINNIIVITKFEVKPTIETIQLLKNSPILLLNDYTLDVCDQKIGHQYKD